MSRKPPPPPDPAMIRKLKTEMVERRFDWLVRAPNLHTAHSQAAIELVEDGLAHATRAEGKGKPVWWIRCWPFPENDTNELGVGFPHVSLRNME